MNKQKCKILITTSGIGSRLGDLTKYTNKCLVNVGDKPAISHIIEHYPDNSEYVVTLGYFGNYVKQFLELTYPNRNFTFVDVDKFEGEGSSLGYSISLAKNYLQCPFVYHACDTIIGEQDKIPNFEENWCLYAKSHDNSQYATLNIKDDKLKIIEEKGSLELDCSYIGVSFIRDYGVFWQSLDSLNKSTTLSDTHIVNKMLETSTFKCAEVKFWCDIGNVDKLKESRQLLKRSVNVLEKNKESIFFFDDFVIKFFSDKNIVKNRVSRGINLCNLTPEIIDYSDNFYKYKKVKGDLFSDTVKVYELLVLFIDFNSVLFLIIKPLPSAEFNRSLIIILEFIR